MQGMPKYPEITVYLTDGNAFAVIGAVTKALKRAGVPEYERKEFVDDAMSGDYDHLLQTVVKWINIATAD